MVRLLVKCVRGSTQLLAQSCERLITRNEEGVTSVDLTDAPLDLSIPGLGNILRAVNERPFEILNERAGKSSALLVGQS